MTALLGVLAQAPSDEIEDSARSIWETFLESLPRFATAVVIVLVGWALSRVLRWGLHWLLARRRTRSFARVMSKVLGWAFLALTVFLAVAVTFPSVEPVNILAGLGFFSVAVGFAFQDILENTLAGVLLLFRQPFQAGDQIEVVDQSGTVAEINIRETRLTTFDNESVLIPNRDVYKNVIRVHTYHPQHRVEFEVGIAYENDAADAATAIVDALRHAPGVADDPEPAALVHELGESTVKLRAYFWTGSQRLDSIVTLDAAIQAVKARLDSDGIELPANIVVLQAAPSFKAAVQNAGEVTPAGAMRPRTEDE